MAIQLRPVRPPVAIQSEYHKKLKAFVQELDKSLFWWLRARYRQVDNDLIQTTQDGAMGDLVKELRRLERDWLKKANAFATETADWFSAKIQGYTSITIQNEMKKRDLVRAGFDLKFSYHSMKERAVFKSIVTENVNLIKSIASQHLTQVTGIVLRGIESGHDLAKMSEALTKSFGVTERRAALISRDQTNKATQSLSRQRLMDYGVTKGKWLHTSAGKTYRESHVEMDGEIYDLEEGCYDPDYGDFIQPAELVSCHCCCIPIVDMGKDEEEPQEEEAQEPTPEPKEAPQEEGFSPADSIAMANDFLENKLGIVADYGGMDLGVANIANEAFYYTLEEFPEIQQGLKSVGTYQNMVQKAKIAYEPRLIQTLEALGYREGTKEFQRLYDYKMRGFSSKYRMKSNTLACHLEAVKGDMIFKDLDGIYINKKWGGNIKGFEKAVIEAEKSGYHPQGCDTIKSVVDHELGHHFDFVLKLKNNNEINNFYRTLSKDDITNGLSIYATTNKSEFIAEAWSEYRNNPKPRPIAKRVGDIIVKAYKEKFGRYSNG